MWVFEKKNVCCKVATKYALTTPAPVLYMESLADATKGKAKAADREAEKKKKEKEKDTENRTKETKSSSSDSNTDPASPAQRGCAPTRLRACSRALARRC